MIGKFDENSKIGGGFCELLEVIWKLHYCLIKLLLLNKIVFHHLSQRVQKIDKI
jgi:hypothetical protein